MSSRQTVSVAVAVAMHAVVHAAGSIRNVGEGARRSLAQPVWAVDDVPEGVVDGG